MATSTGQESNSQASGPRPGDSHNDSATTSTPPNANAMPGGTNNTAGGKMKEAGLVDAIKTVHLSDITEIHKKPCVREAFMTGIGAGFGIGSLRGILGASTFTACNWAVGSFIFGSFVMHEYCQRKRALEKQGMKRAVEVIDRKRAEKRLEVQTKIDERRKGSETR